MPIQT